MPLLHLHVNGYTRSIFAMHYILNVPGGQQAATLVWNSCSSRINNCYGNAVVGRVYLILGERLRRNQVMDDVTVPGWSKWGVYLALYESDFVDQEKPSTFNVKAIKKCWDVFSAEAAGKWKRNKMGGDKRRISAQSHRPSVLTEIGDNKNNLHSVMNHFEA
jgi:hypothetical protein